MRYLYLVLIFSCLTVDLYPQWVQLPNNNIGRFRDLHFFDSQTGFITHTGIVLKTTDGGNTWSTAKSPGFMAITFYDQTYAYGASVVGMSMSRSVDGGATWSSLTPPTSNSLWSIAATGPNTAYYAGTGGVVWKTTNGGASFSVLNSGTIKLITDIHFTSGSTGYIAVQEGQVRKTINSGLTWSAVLNEPGEILTEMSWPDASTGYVVGFNGFGRKTTDGGQSWSPLNINTTTYLQGVHFYDENHGVVVGNGGEIWYTNNGGTSWSAQNSGTTADLADAWMFSPTQAIVIGDSGTVLKNTNITVGVLPNEDLVELTVSPNPVNDQLYVTTTSMIHSIEVHDISGKHVFVQHNIGQQKFEVDFSNLSTGYYVVRVNTDRGISYRKVIK